MTEDMRCAKNHLHPNRGSAADCDAGRVFWWGCSKAASCETITDETRPHFHHRTEEEAALCDFEGSPMANFLEAVGVWP